MGFTHPELLLMRADDQLQEMTLFTGVFGRSPNFFLFSFPFLPPKFRPRFLSPKCSSSSSALFALPKRPRNWLLNSSFSAAASQPFARSPDMIRGTTFFSGQLSGSKQSWKIGGQQTDGRNNPPPHLSFFFLPYLQVAQLTVTLTFLRANDSSFRYPQYFRK